MDDTPIQRVWVLTPPKQVNCLKKHLQGQGTFERDIQLIKDRVQLREDFELIGSALFSLEDPQDALRDYLAVPTTVTVTNSKDRSLILEALGLDPESERLLGDFALAIRRQDAHTGLSSPQSKAKNELNNGRNALERVVKNWLNHLSADVREQLHLDDSQLLQSSSWKFYKYDCLLILPPSIFGNEKWASLLANLQPGDVQELYKVIAAALGVTHIAEQAPIPFFADSSNIYNHENGEQRHSRTSPRQTDTAVTRSINSAKENVLRAPLALRPLYGEFGSIGEEVSVSAFERALWVTVRQNGIGQTFAPLYSMFANGNVNEKRRTLEFAKADLRDGPCQRGAAVDLYSGIGYFAFSYARAGYKPVLCWELNAWSVEGLRRGAKLNKWTCQTFTENEEIVKGRDEQERSIDRTFLVFNETNQKALRRIKELRDTIAPIRHVSCGYLPSSEASWADAVRILDPNFGGWVHAHLNCAADEVEEQARRVEAMFQAITGALTDPTSTARCEHVERVKSYAPGVVHCVFDVHVQPANEAVHAVSEP